MALGGSEGGERAGREQEGERRRDGRTGEDAARGWIGVGGGGGARRTRIGTGLRLALHSFACRELSYNYLSACNGSTGIATANATTG